MSKRFFVLSVLAAAAMVLVACGSTAAPFACTDAIGCVDVAPGDPIHLAWIQTVTGATAPLGTTNVRGAEVALNDVNFKLLGHDIQWDGEDSLCSQEGGQAAGAKIASDSTVVAVVGTTCSSEARGAMPLLADAGMVMISPSNTNPDLTNPDHPDHHVGYLRTAHNDLFQGRIAAEFAYNELGLTSAATIHDGSPYAESLQAVFADVFAELGGTVTSQEAINVGDTEMSGVLTTIATGSPQIIYFPIFEPEGNFIADQKCDVSGLESTVMMGADGLLTTTFPPAAGSCAVGMYMSGPYVGGDAMAAFLDKYNSLFGEGPAAGFAPHSADAMNMILAAITKVAVVDADGTVHIGRQALRDALYGTSGFAGLTGSLTCDANGDCATGEALAVFQISQANVDGTADLLTNTPFWQPGQ
jgi:branched-chain amino acid transport system substrate-binding protein